MASASQAYRWAWSFGETYLRCELTPSIFIGYPGHELDLLGVDEAGPFSGVFDGNGHTISGPGRNSTKEYSSGALFGYLTGDDRTGGLVGHNYEGEITCCYSSAVVVGNDGVGGLVGENWQGLVTNCYSAANVKGDRLTGGLVSRRHDDDVSGCFWDVSTTGCEWSAAGTGMTTAEMRTATAFLAAGWDFLGETANGVRDIWSIFEGQDCPRLRWQSPMNP